MLTIALGVFVGIVLAIIFLKNWRIIILASAVLLGLSILIAGGLAVVYALYRS